MPETSNNQTAATSPSAQWTKRIRPWHIFLAFLLIASLRVGVGVLQPTEKDPLLTQEALDSAVKQWEENGPKSYTWNIHFRSTTSEVDFHVEVSNGDVVAATRNGIDLEPGNRNSWTVANQLEVIQQDLTALKSGTLDTTDDIYTVFKAQFDEKLGYPTSYARESRGSPVNFWWNVTSFTTNE